MNKKNVLTSTFKEQILVHFFCLDKMCTLLPLGVRKNLSWSTQFAFYKNICYNKDTTIENKIKKGRLFDAFNS